MSSAALSVALAACGSVASDTAGETSGIYPVSVSASFPTQQLLAQHADMVVSVTNHGTHPLPDVAVTITNPQTGTAAQAFGELLAAPAPGQQPLAGRSRPVWVIDQAPGPCRYSCQQGGPGGAVTAFSDTWALGRLAPGQTARFDWKVTALRSGSFGVRYQVAAGLSGRAKAIGDTSGTFHVQVSGKPAQQYVNNAGQVVNQN